MCPIKGLTDSVQAAFPRIGKLVKGSEATRDASGKVVKIGQDLPYFRFVSERADVAAAFEGVYGDKPALVNVFIPYANVEDAFQCWKEKWAAGGLVHRCDGEMMTLWQESDGTYNRTPKPCPGGCDEIGRLALIIPELVKAGFVGYVTHQTHGINDLLSIQASLLAAAEARVGNPLGLRGIQWILRRVKEKISTPAGNGKRARRDKWLVKLEPAADWVRLQLDVAHNATMMLPAPSQSPETGEIFDEPVEPGEFTEEAQDTPTLAMPEPQDEEAKKQGLRETITALLTGRRLLPEQLDTWSKNHYTCSYAELNLEGLIALRDALAAPKVAKS